MELMCFSTARPESTRASAMAALFLPEAISASTSSSRGVRWRSGESAGVLRLDTSDSTTFGSIHEPPPATARTAADQLVDVGHPFLQQVGPPGRPGLEQRQRVGRLDVLAQHDDADPGMGHPQLGCDADTFVGAGGRHADVGDDHVGDVVGDGSPALSQIPARCDQRQVRLGPDEGGQALADQVVIVGEHDPDGHRREPRGVVPLRRARPDRTSGANAATRNTDGDTNDPIGPFGRGVVVPMSPT